MEFGGVALIVGAAFAALFGAVMLTNRSRGRRDARRREERTGAPPARHAGGHQSQRGRVFRSGSTNHQSSPNT
ncbi:hypothetical protein [Plantibacter sp. YIM 135347]|uniref:hypothetical protein n=1 Tax=Plantibacter sp. YIM 135347 TaxID=3423919 RepID=UPI003D343814